MKGLIKKLSIVAAACLIANIAFAENNHKNNNNKITMKNHKMMWVCETNASGASTDADKKADEKMKEGMRSAQEAFSFAASHCRDCTKITCSAEEKDTTTKKDETKSSE